MSQPHIRILPLECADGAHNMAADEVLLMGAIEGEAALRFYTWSQATLSLGYFQPANTRTSNPLLSVLPYVRRPSGGFALVHHFELTYALALPAGKPWQVEGSWLLRMHEIIAQALHSLGVACKLLSSAAELGLRSQARGCMRPLARAAGSTPQQTLCFAQVTESDIVIGATKIVGSAQRKHKGALMQHGGILLARSPYAPVLPGIKELSGIELSSHQVAESVLNALSKQTAWELTTRAPTARELGRREGLAVGKYAQPAWNDKR